MCTSTYTVTQDDVDSGQAAGHAADRDRSHRDPVGHRTTATPTDGASAQNPSGAAVTAAAQTVYVYGTGAHG